MINWSLLRHFTNAKSLRQKVSEPSNCSYPPKSSGLSLNVHMEQVEDKEGAEEDEKQNRRKQEGGGGACRMILLDTTQWIICIKKENRRRIDRDDERLMEGSGRIDRKKQQYSRR